MTARLRGLQAMPARGLALVVLVCAAAGLISGVSPKYGVAVAIGLGFVATIFANLTVGVALFTVLSFLDLLSAGAAVSFMKVAGVLLLMSWLFTRSAGGRTDLGSVAERHPALTSFSFAFLAWNLMSAAWAESSGTSLTLVYRLTLVMTLIPIVYTAVRERRHAYIVVAAFVIGAVISALYGLVHPPAPTSAVSGRLTGGLGDANYQASVLVPAIVLSVGLGFVVRRSPRLLTLAGLAAAIAFLGLVYTLSRGGLIAFGCALIAGVVFGGRWRRGALVLLAVGVVSIIGYYAVLAPSSATTRVTSSGTSGRNDLWRIAVRMFSAHPINGIGAGNFPVSSVHYLQRPGLVTAGIYIVKTPKVTHNIYLQQLAELGLPGLLLLLGVFIAGASAALRAAHIFERLGDRDMEVIARCALLALIALLASDFFISDLVSKQLWIVVALCLALAGIAQGQSLAMREPSR